MGLYACYAMNMLRCHADSDATQLDVELSSVELSCVAINRPLERYCTNGELLLDSCCSVQTRRGPQYLLSFLMHVT